MGTAGYASKSGDRSLPGVYPNPRSVPKHHPDGCHPIELKNVMNSLFNFISTREQLLRRAKDVLNGVREGWLKLRIDHVLPLEKAAEAHRLLEGRKTVGKVILKIGD